MTHRLRVVHAGRGRVTTRVGGTAAAIALTLVAAASVAVARGGFVDESGVINGCVDAKGGLRIVAAGALCEKNETGLAWNQTGPTGPPGPTGPSGPPGATGANGETRVLVDEQFPPETTPAMVYSSEYEAPPGIGRRLDTFYTFTVVEDGFYTIFDHSEWSYDGGANCASVNQYYGTVYILVNDDPRWGIASAHWFGFPGGTSEADSPVTADGAHALSVYLKAGEHSLSFYYQSSLGCTEFEQRGLFTISRRDLRIVRV